MYCKQCGNYNDDRSEICETCGASLHENYEEVVTQTTKNEPKLIFNVIYACLTMAGTFPNVTGIVESLLSITDIWELFGLLFGCAISAYGLATGILLLRKKKLGRVFAMINSVLGTIVGALATILGGFCTFGSAALFGGIDIERVAGVFAAIFGVIILIGGALALAYNIFSFIYYKKNKDLFQ